MNLTRDQASDWREDALQSGINRLIELTSFHVYYLSLGCFSFLVNYHLHVPFNLKGIMCVAKPPRFSSFISSPHCAVSAPICLWNANRCTSLRTAYLIFETSWILFSSSFFNLLQLVSLFSPSDVRKNETKLRHHGSAGLHETLN